MAHIWEWFEEVYDSGGGWSPALLSYGEIKAYSEVNKLEINSFEAKLLRALSASYVQVYNMKQKKMKPDLSEFVVAEDRIPVVIPEGMTKVMNMTDVVALKEYFRNIGKKPTPPAKKAKPDGPRDDRPESG